MQSTSLVKSFRQDFYSLVGQIPEGRVSTYGALARALGSERAARAVGKMLNENPRPVEVPCHRVVRSDGSLGGYGRGEEEKKRLLEEEGVGVKEGEVRDFEKIVFEDFESDKPLETLREEQQEVKEKVVVEESGIEFSLVAGVDVSYSDGKAYPALSLWDNGNKEEIDVFTTEVDVDFPYIPTFLAFRELPCLMAILEVVEKKPDVIMVDGNGVMHPDGIGLASHLGVEADIPTIGVAKSKLCGSLVEEIDREKNKMISEVRRNGKLIGHALLEGKRAKKPIYVSPGHGVSHVEAIKLVRSYCTYKVPDPIRRAHIQATKRRKKDER
ncbi:MAG: endonuclease V [Candidatus Thermoplasmatota archaeon]